MSRNVRIKIKKIIIITPHNESLGRLCSEAEFLLGAHVMFVGVLLDCSQPSIFWYFSIDEQHEGVNRIARELEASAKRKT